MRWNTPSAPLLRALPLALVLAFGSAQAAPQADLLEHAKKEQQPYLDTLRDLVHIESGSKDVAGVKKIAEYIAGKLRAQGGKVEVIEFFWYSCGHCNAFEPTLEAWIKSAPKELHIRRVPVAFNSSFVPQQKLYYTLEGCL